MGRRYRFDVDRINSGRDPERRDINFNGNHLLPDTLQILSTVGRKAPADLYDYKNVTWAHYLEPAGGAWTLRGVDAIPLATPRPRIHPSDFEIPHTPGDRILAAGSVLRLGKLSFYKNDQPYFSLPGIASSLPVDILPDLILRRAFVLLYDKEPISFGTKPISEDVLRHGVIFNTIKQSEVMSGIEAPEASDWPGDRQPLEIEGYLSQWQVDEISLMARHYTRYCLSHRLPVLWPEPGLWPNWPANFRRFAESQDHERYIDMSEWRQRVPSGHRPAPGR